MQIIPLRSYPVQLTEVPKFAIMYTGESMEYLEYLAPSLLVPSIVFAMAGAFTIINVNEDINKRVTPALMLFSAATTLSVVAVATKYIFG